ASGSNDVDLEDATIQWVTASSASSLVAMTDGQVDPADGPVEDSPDGAFYWNTLRDPDNSISQDNTLNDQADRATLVFDLDDDEINGGSGVNSGLDPLASGETAEIQIDTRAGGSTTVTLVVPDSLSGKTSVSL
ncbi:MAG: flagellin, partial [Halapricum sp.]